MCLFKRHIRKVWTLRWQFRSHFNIYHTFQSDFDRTISVSGSSIDRIIPFTIYAHLMYYFAWDIDAMKMKFHFPGQIDHSIELSRWHIRHQFIILLDKISNFHTISCNNNKMEKCLHSPSSFTIFIHFTHANANANANTNTNTNTNAHAHVVFRRNCACEHCFFLSFSLNSTIMHRLMIILVKPHTNTYQYGTKHGIVTFISLFTILFEKNFFRFIYYLCVGAANMHYGSPGRNNAIISNEMQNIVLAAQLLATLYSTPLWIVLCNESSFHIGHGE